MKFLVIGLGSMGKRRVRNLQALSYKEIAGFDLRQDRIKEVKDKYNIKTFNNFESALRSFSPNALIISTSPESHMEYAFKALELNIPSFIEASVVEKDKIKELDQLSRERNLFFAPSCTMKYFQGPIKVKKLLHDKTIGKPLFFNYHTGQSLEEWHPWEKPNEYYVSKRETGAAREIVPFELTWLCDLFGEPKILSAQKAKLSQVDANIDDFYTFSSEFSSGLKGNITVDVITPFQAARRLHVVGEKGQIIFDGNSNEVIYTSLENKEWKNISLTKGNIQSGYINPENPYISEMSDFISAIENKNPLLFPNTLQKDYQILTYLDQVEELCQ